MSDSPKVKGHVTEQIVQSELMRRGYTVLEPVGDNERYDLVVEESGDFTRVQVKTGTIRNGKVVFSTDSTNYKKGSWENNSYNGEADWFIVYCYERDEFYEVSVSEAPNSSMHIRFEEPGCPSPNINWTGDYLMTERFK